MTNYEHIKNMSVDEIAELFKGICPYALDPIRAKQRQKGRLKCLSGIGCNECRKDWLNSEVDDG